VVCDVDMSASQPRAEIDGPVERVHELLAALAGDDRRVVGITTPGVRRNVHVLQKPSGARLVVGAGAPFGVRVVTVVEAASERLAGGGGGRAGT
jgi:hypothetical protein